MTTIRIRPAALTPRSPLHFLRPFAVAASLALMCSATAIASGPRGSVRRADPARATIVDIGQRIDVNQISMVVTNTGSIAYDKMTGAAGLEFPKGTGKTAVFAAGPWFGALVNGQVRVAISEYSDEYGPGPVFGGSPSDPNLPEHKVYKLSRVYDSASERDSVLAYYEFGAEPYGAPDVEVQADGTLNILGDQMLWSVYNDLDPALHYNRAGSTPPLGIEVSQTVYAFDRPDALGRTVFVRYRIRNAGGNVLQDSRFAIWSDPDLGGITDDLVGSDTTRSLGYCYNANNEDFVYGATPPAVGFDLLRVLTPFGQRLPATAFIKYINGTDPDSASESFNYLHGLDAHGNPIINPVTGQPTTFFHSGDPVAATGWLDTAPGDKRFVLCSGPFDAFPGDTFEVTVGIVIGQGADRLSSITQLRSDDDFIQAAFDSPPPPPPPSCPVSVVFDFNPNTLNLRSMGRWVSGRLEPSAPYGPGDIDVGSIRLNDTVPVDLAKPPKIGDENGNGTPDLTVKFDRAAVQAAVSAGDSVPVVVSGDIGAECFTGVDVIRVKHPKVTAPAAGAVIASGRSTRIRWQTPAGVATQWVAVLVSLDGGENWSLVTRDLPNSGEYDWHVPYANAPNAHVAVVLVERQLSEDEVEGFVGISDRFSIANTTGVGPAGPAFALQGAVPQPARGALRLSITLPDARPATIALYDAAGRRVWARDVGALGPGTHSVMAGEGAALPAGVYLVRLFRAGEKLEKRAVLLP